jgi:hypothetical protein
VGAALLAATVVAAPVKARAHYEPCTVVGGEDSCLSGEGCTAKDGGVGICLPPPCKIDADCRTAPLLRCDTRSSPAVCIECYGDAECAAPKTCELDPRSPASYRCVECRLGGPPACEAADAGHRCVVERGRCGCAASEDCPPEHFCRRDVCVPRPKAGTSGGEDAGADEAGGAGTSALSAGGDGCSTIGAREEPATFAWLALVAVLVAARRLSRD